MNPEPDLRPDKRIDEYVLIARLSSYSQVWHAFDEGAQREVVLKFVSDKESASREGTILADIDHPNILKLLRKFVFNGDHVLVFEYVPGVRLDKAIREGVNRENSFRISIDVCSALAEMHTYGLYHGDLSPFNVIWSSAKSKAFLIDFGAMGGCTVLSATPEHDPANRMSIGPHTDMVGLGRILMLLLPEMKFLYDKCMYDEISQRPTAAYVLTILKKAQDKRKFILRTLKSTLLLLAVALSAYFFREPGKDDLVQKIVVATPSQETVSLLREKLWDPQFKGFRNTIVSALADHNQRLGQEPVIVDSLDTYVAIFAVDDHPMVLLEEGLLQLGDLAVIAGEGGHIQEINRGSVVITTGNGSKEIKYPKPPVFGRESQIYRPINIMASKNNFFRILRAIAKVKGLHFQENGEIDGTIVGSFLETSYGDFLKNLVGHVNLVAYNISVQGSAIPRSIISGEPFWLFRGRKLSDQLALYEPYIGYTLIYSGKEDSADLVYPVMQFHDLIDTMGLTIVVDDQQLIVSEGDF